LHDLFGLEIGDVTFVNILDDNRPAFAWHMNRSWRGCWREKPGLQGDPRSHRQSQPVARAQCSSSIAVPENLFHAQSSNNRGTTAAAGRIDAVEVGKCDAWPKLTKDYLRHDHVFHSWRGLD
jgi:hypothetical protein